MGVLAAGSVFGLLLTPMIIAPGLMQWAWIAPLIVTGAYFLTFLRGAKGVLADTTFGAWSKAVIYAVVLMGLVLLAGVFISIISAVYAIVRLRMGS
jgi:hypothetical protein